MVVQLVAVNWSSPGQNGRSVSDDIFKRIFFNEKLLCLSKHSLKFVPEGPTDKNPALVYIYRLGADRRQAIIWTNAGAIRWPEENLLIST